ncbi:MAG: bifunctional oligoribonuclease/PAP phosphatase NrnA [Candidatus Enterenecus sp.]
MDYREAAAFLRAHDNYLIITHKRPDGDAIGCSVALAELLRAVGKTAWLLPSLDATAIFTEYLEGQTAPAGFVPDTVVSVDMAGLGLLPPNGEPWRNAIALSIDHHPSNEGYAAHTCLEGDKAACGEILWKIAGELGIMNRTIADALYVAVSTDTGCFVYSNVTPHTHRAAAALMEAGADYKRLNKKHFRTKTMARMRLESLILLNMHLYRDGVVAVAPISLDMMAQAGATENDAEDIAAFVGQVEGVRHSATIRELKPGECKISLRTAADLNASHTCARLGGGGHAAAAGCTVYGTVEEAERAIMDAINAQMAER